MFVKHPELKLKALPWGEAGLLEYRKFIYSENVQQQQSQNDSILHSCLDLSDSSPEGCSPLHLILYLQFARHSLHTSAPQVL